MKRAIGSKLHDQFAKCFNFAFAVVQVYDKEFPEDQSNGIFCSLLSSYIPPPFKLVFANKHYRVLRVSTS